ncbi:unnamed protein product [Victoria cruziana]
MGEIADKWDDGIHIVWLDLRSEGSCGMKCRANDASQSSPQQASSILCHSQGSSKDSFDGHMITRCAHLTLSARNIWGHGETRRWRIWNGRAESVPLASDACNC